MALAIPIITEFDGKGIKSALNEFKNLESGTEKVGFAAKKAGDVQVLSDEKRLKRELHLWIYGEFTEGVHGYVSDEYDEESDESD